MSTKQAEIIYTILTAVSVILLVVCLFSGSRIYAYVTAGVILLSAVFSQIFRRCPRCGRGGRRPWRRECPYCKEKILK